MLAEILSVGTELLMGQIVNTDAQYISRRLSELGVNIYRQTTVGDNPARVREAVQTALSRADVVITTGGLGPTEDDLTKEMVAEVLGLEMELHQPSLDAMTAYMNRIEAELLSGVHITDEQSLNRAADRLLDRLLTALDQLSRFPLSAPEVLIGGRRPRKYYRVPVPPYNIYYRIIGERIIVMRVLHERMDAPGYL